MEKGKYNIGSSVFFCNKEMLINFIGIDEDLADKISGRKGIVDDVITKNDKCYYIVLIGGMILECTDSWFEPEGSVPISEDYLIKPESESRKNDRQDEKEMWELLPFETIEEAVKVFTFGAKKYGVNTWQNLPNGFERYRAAFLRHMVAHLKGEEHDPESGLLHLSHCLWNSIAMLHVYMAGKKKERRGKIFREAMEQDQMDKVARTYEKEIQSEIEEAPKAIDAYFKQQRDKAKESQNKR